MKKLVVSFDNSAVTVETKVDGPLTIAQAQEAALVAFGHAMAVTVDDGENIVLLNHRFSTERLELVQLHPMDSAGTVRGIVAFPNHEMTVSPWWDNDGTTGEICRCTCGFVSRQFSGNGAWQAGHDGPPQEHSFDAIHAALREAAAEWERAQPWLDFE